ncbi:hypothetical protein [uncultured Mucilaginibacter sp.]|uniref:hypothetical protein n=1 Tax=uncultured Mucilaginibacter sp. TaxID=797541 RepID=UPI0025DC8FF6|nr:hypothetical protein [uncultured Mucilaginibacter sp.]
MRLLLNLSLIFLTIPCFLHAQGNYQPGVIVNLKGDTVRGYIQYTEWDNNPDKIFFKTSTAGTAVALTPDSIRFFSAAVGHLAKFVAYAGPVSTDITDITRLAIGRDSSYRMDKIFLKVLQEGKNLLLFSYADNLKTRFFVAGNYAEKPAELVYRIYYNSIEENGWDRTSYENIFKSQLYNQAVKAGVMNPALKKQIQATDYKEAALQNTAGLINSISAADQSKNNPRKPSGFLKAIAIAGGIAVIIWFVHDLAVHNSR